MKLGFKNNASFKWSGSNDWKLNLGNIEFPEGKLSIIQGPTGSGKSSRKFQKFPLTIEVFFFVYETCSLR